MIKRRTLASALLLVATLAAGPVLSQSIGVETGLPLPRFESLRYDKVNLRRGASEAHPIAVVYVREGLPVEILREYRDWRRVRDHEGTTGWIKRTQLSTRQTAIVVDAPAPLLRSESATARQLATLSPGVIVEIRDCNAEWCGVKVRGYTGYVPRAALWGVKQVAGIGGS